MNLDITSRGFTPSSELIELINTKVEKLSKFDKNISDIIVVLKKESRAEKVELIVESKRNTYVSKRYSSAFEKTLVMSIDNIKSFAIGFLSCLCLMLFMGHTSSLKKEKEVYGIGTYQLSFSEAGGFMLNTRSGQLYSLSNDYWEDKVWIKYPEATLVK